MLENIHEQQHNHKLYSEIYKKQLKHNPNFEIPDIDLNYNWLLSIL